MVPPLNSSFTETTRKYWGWGWGGSGGKNKHDNKEDRGCHHDSGYEYTTLIPDLKGKWKQENQEFCIIFLSYITSSKPAWSTGDFVTHTYTYRDRQTSRLTDRQAALEKERDFQTVLGQQG